MKILFKKINSRNFTISLFVFLIYFKIFFLLTNYQQFFEIYKYSNSFLDFYKDSFKFFLTFWSSLNSLTYFLSLLFFIFTYFFILSFLIAKAGMQNLSRKKLSLSVFASVVSFFGFGCVACGQTLIYPVLLFVFTSVSGNLVEYVGNFAMLLGIVFLFFGIRQNLKLIEISDTKICKV